jgi:hypothetical protein
MGRKAQITSYISNKIPESAGQLGLKTIMEEISSQVEEYLREGYIFAGEPIMINRRLCYQFILPNHEYDDDEEEDEDTENEVFPIQGDEESEDEAKDEEVHEIGTLHNSDPIGYEFKSDHFTVTVRGEYFILEPHNADEKFVFQLNTIPEIIHCMTMCMMNLNKRFM